MPARIQLYTVGHSTRAIEDFLTLLEAYDIQSLVDIRTIPKSRHNPQFAADSLAQSLGAAGVSYSAMQDLGGLRSTRKDSINTGWRNKSFRGFADYMQTAAFNEAIGALIEGAHRQRTAVMCAEAVPWRCHRSLVGDAVLVRGHEVIDIMSPTQSRAHIMTSFAKVEGTRVTYPG